MRQDMTDEELKLACIDWARRQHVFPKYDDWIINRYETDPPPCGRGKLIRLFGSYNLFRNAAGTQIVKHDSSDPVTLEVLKQDCIVSIVSLVPNIVTPCWIWQKSLRKGYAKKGIQNKMWSVHKYVHEILGCNPNPSTDKKKKEYTVDHLCRQRACINPDHLRWATASEQGLNQNKVKKSKHLSRPPKASCLEERLNWYLSECDKDDNGCIIPPLTPKEDGYSQIKYKNKDYKLHILSALQKNNHPISREFYESFTDCHKVLHLCNRKACCNPDHLEIREGVDANRQNSLDARSYHAGVRLQKEDIPEIRDIFDDCKALGWKSITCYRHIASIYGVVCQTIKNIILGVSWKDV
jgi:hypothetical protein